MSGERHVARLPVEIILVIIMMCVIAAPLTINPLDVQSFVLRYGAEAYAGQPLYGIRAAAALALVAVFFVPSNNPLTVLPTDYKIFLSIAALSTLWSISPSTTLRQTVVLAGLAYITHAIIGRYGIWPFLRVVWLSGVAFVAVSLLFGLAGSDYVLMRDVHMGSWRGFLPHKNSFGPLAACILVLSIFCGSQIIPSRLLRHTGMALCLVAMATANSASAVVALVFATLAGGVNRILIRGESFKPVTLVMAGLILLTGIVVIDDVLPDLAQLLGRDISFTGRTSLWSAVLPISLQSPLGFGYGTSGGEAVVSAMRQFSGWQQARTTHNAYLALALDLGWAVTAAYVAWLLAKIVVLRSVPKPQRATIEARSVMAAFMLAWGMADSAAGPYATFPLLMLIALTARPARVTVRRERAPPAPAFHVRPAPTGGVMRSATAARRP